MSKVYTHYDLKKMISEAIPKGADKELLMLALTEIVADNMVPEVSNYALAIANMEPEAMSTENALAAKALALSTHAMSASGKDHLIGNLKFIKSEVEKMYLQQMLTAVAREPKFKVEHQQELNRIAYGGEENEFLTEDVVKLLSNLLQDNIPAMLRHLKEMQSKSKG